MKRFLFAIIFVSLRIYAQEAKAPVKWGFWSHKDANQPFSQPPKENYNNKIIGAFNNDNNPDFSAIIKANYKNVWIQKVFELYGSQEEMKGFTVSFETGDPPKKRIAIFKVENGKATQLSLSSAEEQWVDRKGKFMVIFRDQGNGAEFFGVKISGKQWKYDSAKHRFEKEEKIPSDYQTYSGGGAEADAHGTVKLPTKPADF